MAHTLQVLATHSYPAYQFIAQFEYEQHSPEECFRFLILTVLDWICNRLGDEALDQMLGPRFPAESASDSCFQSLSREEPCRLDIISLVDDGIWAAQITEPDMDRDQRKAVVGRSFVSNVGIRLAENDRGNIIVLLGIRIDVHDPENATMEVPFAYRPAFIKTLFSIPEIRAYQASYPVKRGCFTLNDKDSLQKVTQTLSDRNCFLPAFIFTSPFKLEDIEESLSDIDRKLGLADSKSSILSQARLISEIPERLGKSLLAYSRVFSVSTAAFDSFKIAFNLSDDFMPGDMLLVEPEVFGRRIYVIRYTEEQSRILRDDYFTDTTDRLYAFSKRKVYNFSPVLFVPEALSVQRQQRLEKVRQETETLTFEQLSDVVAENEAEISKLRGQVEKLERENIILSERLRQTKSDLPSVSIFIPDEVEEYFPGEIRDLILTVLRNRDAMSARTPDTRATEILRQIVEMDGNALGTQGQELFDQIQRIFNGHKNFGEGDFAELRSLGFVIEETKQGDGHIRAQFKTSQRFHPLPSTGSDVRGLKNSFSSFEKKESVYKV